MLAVKGNQGQLYEAVVDFFETAEAADFKGVPVDYYEDIDSGHGRIDIRRYWTTSELTTLPNPTQWAGLTSIAMMESERHRRHVLFSSVATTSPHSTAMRVSSASPLEAIGH